MPGKDGRHVHWSFITCFRSASGRIRRSSRGRCWPMLGHSKTCLIKPRCRLERESYRCISLHIHSDRADSSARQAKVHPLGNLRMPSYRETDVVWGKIDVSAEACIPTESAAESYPMNLLHGQAVMDLLGKDNDCRAESLRLEADPDMAST